MSLIIKLVAELIGALLKPFVVVAAFVLVIFLLTGKPPTTPNPTPCQTTFDVTSVFTGTLDWCPQPIPNYSSTPQPTDTPGPEPTLAPASDEPTFDLEISPTPEPTYDYIIQKGDTLYNIAKLHRTTVAAILALNPSLRSNPNYILPGQHIKLPGIR